MQTRSVCWCTWRRLGRTCSRLRRRGPPNWNLPVYGTRTRSCQSLYSQVGTSSSGGCWTGRRFDLPSLLSSCLPHLWSQKVTDPSNRVRVLPGVSAACRHPLCSTTNHRRSHRLSPARLCVWAPVPWSYRLRSCRFSRQMQLWAPHS